MTQLKTLRDGLLDGLKDLYSAEHQLVKALPKVEKKASNPNLKTLIRAHLKETEGQVTRLEKIGSLMDEKLSGKACKAMQGLIEECKEVLEEESKNDALIDVMLIGAASRVEHYEMAAYTSVLSMAKTLGEDKVVSLLEESLAEESAANEKLCSLSEDELLSDAQIDEESEDKPTPRPSRSQQPSKSGMRLGAGKLLAIGGILTAFSMNPIIAVADNTASALKNERDAAMHEVDNTGRNARDLNDNRRTADDQTMAAKETEVLAKVRSRIVANDTLSTYGKNVKVVIENGMLTLRGPVTSVSEKNWIGQASAAAAPGYKVVNSLEVVPG